MHTPKQEVTSKMEEKPKLGKGNCKTFRLVTNYWKQKVDITTNGLL